MQEQVIGVIIQQADGNYKLGHVLNLLDKYRKSQLLSTEQFDLVYRQVIKEARQDANNWALKYLRTVESCQSQIKTVRYNENMAPAENKSVRISTNAIEFEKQYSIIKKPPAIKIVNQKGNIRPIFGFVKRRYLECLSGSFKAIIQKGNSLHSTNDKAIKQHRRLRVLTKIIKQWRKNHQTKVRNLQLLNEFKTRKITRILKRVFQCLQYYVSYEKFDQSSTIEFFKAHKDNKTVKRIFSTLYSNLSKQKTKERILNQKANLFRQNKVNKLYINKWKEFMQLKQIKQRKCTIVCQKCINNYQLKPLGGWIQYHRQNKNTSIKVQLFLRKLYLIKPLSKWIQQHYGEKKLTLLIFSFKQSNRDKLVSGIFYTLYFYKQQVDQERNKILINYESSRSRFIKSTVFTLIISKISKKLKLQDRLMHSMMTMKQRILKSIFKISQYRKNTLTNRYIIQQNTLIGLQQKYFRYLRIAYTNSQYARLEKKQAKQAVLDVALEFQNRFQLKFQQKIFIELRQALRKRIQKHKIASYLIKYYQQILKQKILLELQNYSILKQRQKVKFIKAKQFMKKLYKIKPMSRWIQLSFRSKRLKLITQRIQQNTNKNLLLRILESMRLQNHQMNFERTIKLTEFQQYMKHQTIKIYFHKICQYQQYRHRTRQRCLEIQYNSQLNKKQRCLTQIIPFLTAKAILTIKYQITSKYFSAFKNYVHRNRLPEQQMIIVSKQSSKTLQIQPDVIKYVPQKQQEYKIQNQSVVDPIIEQKIQTFTEDKPIIDFKDKPIIDFKEVPQKVQQQSKHLKNKSKKKLQQNVLVENIRVNQSQNLMHKIMMFLFKKMQQKRVYITIQNQIRLKIQNNQAQHIFSQLKHNVEKQQLKRNNFDRVQNTLINRYQFKPMSKWILYYLSIKQDSLKIQQFQEQVSQNTISNTFFKIKTYIDKQSAARSDNVNQFRILSKRKLQYNILQIFKEQTTQDQVRNQEIILRAQVKRTLRIKSFFVNLIKETLENRVVQEQKRQRLIKISQNQQVLSKRYKSKILKGLRNYADLQERYRSIESDITLRRNLKRKESIFQIIRKSYKNILHQKISEQSIVSGCKLLKSFCANHSRKFFVDTFKLLIDIVHEQLANQMGQYEILINRQSNLTAACKKFDVELSKIQNKQKSKSFRLMIDQSKISKFKQFQKSNYFRIWKNKVSKQQAVSILASLNLNRIQYHYKHYFLQKIRFTSKLVKAIQVFENYALRQVGTILIKSLKLSNKIFIRQQLESRNSLLFSCFREWRLMTGEQVLLKKYLKECDNQGNN